MEFINIIVSSIYSFYKPIKPIEKYNIHELSEIVICEKEHCIIDLETYIFLKEMNENLEIC